MRHGKRVAALGAAGVLAGAVAMAAASGVARAGSAPAADMLRIGVVDMQAVITQSARGQKARAQLQAETEGKQKDMSSREEEARKLQAELERQKAVLSPAALREKEEAIQRRVREIRRSARLDAAVISSTASSNAAWCRAVGAPNPVTFRTYWRAASRISSSAATSVRVRRRLMLLHMGQG